jgi:long-chain acyl-CoA synthetase
MNIANNLRQAATYFPDQTAVIDSGRKACFMEFYTESKRVASALWKIGVRPGDHVAICGPNSYRWLAFYFGAMAAGAVVVSLSHSLTRMELPQVLCDARPKILFTIDEKLDDLGDRNDHPYLEVVVSPHGDIGYKKLVESGEGSFSIVDREHSDIAAILYTGGTTGIPKGVMLTNENLMTSINNVSHNERSTHRDSALCFLPLNHVFGQIHIMNATIYSAGSLVILPSFDLDGVLHAIDTYGVTKFYAVPTIYIRLLGLDNLKERLKSIRYCFSAAASMAAEVVREWKARMGLDIYEAYGMTESASMVTYNHYYRHLVGSVGTPVGTIEVQIRDQSGNLVEQGAEGEICIRGPNIMKGYLNQPEETRSAFWKNWFRTGDTGLTDEQGYLFIVDRLKDMIITGGENVYPREIEEILYARPEVEECTVIGLPDKEYGEKVTAFIVLKEGKGLDPVTLKAYLKERLSPFKVPKSFVCVSELPKSSTGKILKRDLKRQILENA